jgi:hypothetical protein
MRLPIPIDEFDLLGDDPPAADPLEDRLTTGALALLEALGAGPAVRWPEWVARLESHLQAEEEVVYARLACMPAAEEELPAALDRHRQLRQAVAAAGSPGSDLFGHRVSELAESLRAHVDEQQFGLLAVPGLDEEDRAALAERWDDRRRRLLVDRLRGLRREVLLAAAADLGLRGRSRMNRATLAEALA